MTRPAMRARRILAGLALLLVAETGNAQPASPDDPRGRAFFDVGAEAYGKGQYLLAIDAFREAYAVTPRPGLLFSLAQAHQRQFRTSGDEQHLTLAIEHYRRYLEQVGSGGRSTEASASLNKLLNIAERLHPPDQVQAPARSQIFGRLLLSSRTPSLTLTVNGDAVESLPTSLELPADRYRVVAQARGYETLVQDVVLASGSAFPLSIELRPLPAELELSGPRGAEVFIDGKSAGWLPISVLSLAAGEHWVSVRRSGFRTSSAVVRLERGQRTRLSMRQERSFQRNAAWVVGIGSVVGLGIAGVLSLTAYDRDRDARALEERRRSASLPAEDGQRLNAALEARDELRTGAALAGGVGVAMLGSALFLYFAETPEPPAFPTSRGALRISQLGMKPLIGSTWGLGANGVF